MTERDEPVTDGQVVDADSVEFPEPEVDAVVLEGELEAGGPTAAELAAALAVAEAEVAERTKDLQQLQAQYANYRRRVERDKVVDREAAKAALAGELVAVLDDLDRARAHGDLENSPLRSVADKLASVLATQGLTSFGVEGDTFDPSLHEAVQHEGDGSDPVIGAVYRKGYTFGDRVLRTAMVSVVDRPQAAEAVAEPGDQQV